MGKGLRPAFLAGIVWLLLLLAAGRTYSAGFGLFTQGSRALGQADSVVAHGSGPSDIFFNPAQIAGRPGTRVELGTTVIGSARTFHSAATGETAHEDSGVYFPSTFYLARALGRDLGLGLGVFNPFGLGTRWPDGWEGRYLATRSEMTTYNVNPVLAYRFLPGLRAAAGVDVIFLDATLEKRVNTAALGTLLNVPGAGQFPDAGQKFSGRGQGVGYNLGVAVDLTERIALGASYRSRVKVSLDGRLRHSNVPPGLEEALPDSDAESSLTLPAVFLAGVSYRPWEALVGEVGVRWEEWSVYDELDVELDRPVLGQTRSVQPRDWRDTWAFHAGIEWRLGAAGAVRAGYLYGQSAVPGSTLEPAVPDADSHLVTAGADLAWRGFTVSLAYGMQRFVARRKENSLGDPVTGLPETRANGTYRSTIHLVGLSVSRAF